jgi:hypothetical protein
MAGPVHLLRRYGGAPVTTIIAKSMQGGLWSYEPPLPFDGLPQRRHALTLLSVRLLEPFAEVQELRRDDSPDVASRICGGRAEESDTGVETRRRPHRVGF